MPALVVIVIFLLGFGLGILVAWIRPKPVLDKREKTELERLRTLEGKITTVCLQHADDPFAYVIIDELNASRTSIERRKDGF